MDQVCPCCVAQDLHFDVLGAPDVALHEHVGPAEGRAGFALGLFELARQLFGVLHHAHAAPAAAEAGFDDDGKAHVLRRRAHVRERGHRILGARHRGHLRFDGQVLGRHLVAERFELFRCGADEGDARQLTRAREIRVLGEKSVAGMDGIHAVALRHFDDGRDVEVRPDRFAAGRRTNQERLVGLEPVQREPVFVAVDGHRLQAELSGGAKNADGDFRAVGDEEFFHGCRLRKYGTVASIASIAAGPRDAARR